MIKTIAILTTILVSTFNSCSSKNAVKGNSNSVNASELINLINEGKDIYIENKIIEGVIDLTQLKTGSDENKNIHRISITSSLTFLHCIFTEKIIGYSTNDSKTNLVSFTKNITCIECEFKEEVFLRECTFYGSANFSGTSFVKKTSFEGSNFITDAFFSKSSFSDEARFQNVVFQNKSNFMEAICGKTISFQGAGFTGDAQFSVVKFLAYADFSVCAFSAGCYFNYAEFSNQAIFNNTVFKGRAEFLKSLFNGNTEFKACIFYNIVKMNEATIGNNLNFTNAAFIYSKPDMEKAIKTNNTKIIFENARVTMFTHLTEKDF